MVINLSPYSCYEKNRVYLENTNKMLEKVRTHLVFDRDTLFELEEKQDET